MWQLYKNIPHQHALCNWSNSPPSSAEVKNMWSSNSTPLYVFMAWCVIKHRDNFTFTFTVFFAHLFYMVIRKAKWLEYWSLDKICIYLRFKALHTNLDLLVQLKGYFEARLQFLLKKAYVSSKIKIALCLIKYCTQLCNGNNCEVLGMHGACGINRSSR